MHSDNDVVSIIQMVLSEKLLVEIESPDTDLLKTGVLDSLTLVQLLLNLEERFGLKLPVDQLEIADLRSINSIARLIARRNIAACA
jgi:D-alanine--poly(phosphoribitol) ligase subunit 2